MSNLNNDILVSIVIPCRNEEKYIGRCLDSIIDSNFPNKQLEVIVVDGMSDDGTKLLLKKYSKKHPFIKILNNSIKVTPVAMNIGIRSASGKFIIILSSHSETDNNFLALNVDNIQKQKADCVGGQIVTLPANESIIAKAIAISISHPFGVGNSYFRIGLQEQKYVDTVPFGCYKKETLDKLGLFDEDLVRNQDDELNLRLLRAGGKILLIPEIVSYYVARDSLGKLWKMYYQYGYFKPLVAKKVGGVLTLRQLIPSLMVTSMLILGLLSFLSHHFLWLFVIIVLLYLIGNFSVSTSIAVKKGIRLIFALPIAFAALHFSYGIGYLLGIWNFIILKKQNKREITDIPLSR